MDREALVLRNKTMTEAFHQMPVKHYIRRGLLRLIANLPITRQKNRGKSRILLIRPDHLGDVLLTTPAIRALKNALPRTEIHALVGPWSAEVLANYEELDAVLTLPFPGFSRSDKKSLRFPYELALRSARQLRLVGYSTAIIMRPDHWWGAMLAHLAGIPERVGYNHSDVAPFLTTALAHQHEHAVLQNLHLIQHWTGELTSSDVHYTFPTINQADEAYITEYLKQWQIAPQQAIFVIHPGSGTWVKRWDENHWAEVADTLIGQLDAAVIFTGGDHELPLVRDIAAKMVNPTCIMVGDTQLGQLAALLKRAKVVLGPDSGPLHLAAAVGTPTVALFGPADPVEFAQWGPQDKHAVLTIDIACRPCRVLDWGNDYAEYHPCVKEITVGRVLDAAHRVVKAANPG